MIVRTTLVLTALLGLAALAAFAQQSTPVAPTPKHTRALVTLTGPQNEADAGIELARTEEQFIALWQRHRGEKPTGKYDAHYNPIELPVVDFDRCMVLAIFGKKGWNSAGYRVESIFERDGDLIFRYDDKSYQTAGPDGGGVRVQPYGFFVLPKASHRIVVEKNVQGMIGREPVWREMRVIPKG